MFGRKKKMDVNAVAIKVTAGSAGVGLGGFIFGFTSELGRAKAIKLIRKNDPHYAYPIINFNMGVEEDDLPDEYQDATDIDLEDAFGRLGKTIKNIKAVAEDIDDEYDDEDDDEEDIVDEEPPKIQPNKKS